MANYMNHTECSLSIIFLMEHKLLISIQYFQDEFRNWESSGQSWPFIHCPSKLRLQMKSCQMPAGLMTTVQHFLKSFIIQTCISLSNKNISKKMMTLSRKHIDKASLTVFRNQRGKGPKNTPFYVFLGGHHLFVKFFLSFIKSVCQSFSQSVSHSVSPSVTLLHFFILLMSVFPSSAPRVPVAQW